MTKKVIKKVFGRKQRPEEDVGAPTLRDGPLETAALSAHSAETIHTAHTSYVKDGEGSMFAYKPTRSNGEKVASASTDLSSATTSEAVPSASTAQEEGGRASNVVWVPTKKEEVAPKPTPTRINNNVRRGTATGGGGGGGHHNRPASASAADSAVKSESIFAKADAASTKSTSATMKMVPTKPPPRNAPVHSHKSSVIDVSILDGPDVDQAYEAVPLLDIIDLPRGGVSIETQAVGHVQVSWIGLDNLVSIQRHVLFRVSTFYTHHLLSLTHKHTHTPPSNNTVRHPPRNHQRLHAPRHRRSLRLYSPRRPLLSRHGTRPRRQPRRV